MILISIYPEHVELIKQKIKSYEFRKIYSKKSKNKFLKENYIAVYETKPRSAITLIIKVGNILEDDINILWKKFGVKSGISKDYFMGYYHDKRKGIAIEIKKFLVIKKPIILSEIKKVYPTFIPPQRFYLLSGERYPYLNKRLLKQLKRFN